MGPDEWDAAEKVAQQRHDQAPGQPTEHVVRRECPVVHARRACRHRRDCANHGNEPGEQHRARAVAVEEPAGASQPVRAEPFGTRTVEDYRAGSAADQIAALIADDRRDRDGRAAPREV